MAVKNINSGDYVEWYKYIEQNKIIQWYQRSIKYKFQLPVLKLADRSASIIDIGTARGDFVRFLLDNSYCDVSALDVENALSDDLKRRTEQGNKSLLTFYKDSICSPELNLPMFDNVHIASVLHHLPIDSLKQTAVNLSKITKCGGYLFIYDVNRRTWLGKLYNNFILRLFPVLYNDSERESPEQEAFSKECRNFLNYLECYFDTIKLSFGICMVYIGKRK